MIFNWKVRVTLVTEGNHGIGYEKMNNYSDFPK
jgi:hypothetical protein